MRRCLVGASSSSFAGSMSLMGVGRVSGAVIGGAPSVTADAKSVYTPNGSSDPINIGAGDLVVLVLTGYALTSSATGSSTHLGSFTSAGFAINGGQVLYAYNTGGALTGEVITVSPTVNSWHLYSISGAAPSSPIETPVFIPNTGSSQSLSASITTTHANDLVIANQIGGSSFDAGWTQAAAGQTPYGELNEYRQVSTAGTYTAWAGQTATGSSFVFAVKGP